MAPRWMSRVLVAAGVYNLVWGAWSILLPGVAFSYSGMEDPARPLNYPQVWQGIGMVVGVYGVGYLIASHNPLRHWPVVLVGFLGKVFGPIGVAYGIVIGQTRPQGFLTCITNDLIWWIPFALILRAAYRTRASA